MLKRYGLELVMEFLADQAILERGAGAGHERGREAVLLQHRRLLWCGQVDTLEADARENLAPLFEGERRSHTPHRRHHALLELGPLARGRRTLWRCCLRLAA